MYFDKNIPGILYMGYTDSKVTSYDSFDLGSLLQNVNDYAIPGILIYYNMHIDGAVYITDKKNYYNKSMTINGSASIIIISKFMIICEHDKALPIFKIISSILSNPSADNSIQEAIDNINTIFVF